MSYDDCLRVYRGEPPRGNGPEIGFGTADLGSVGAASKAAKRARKRGGLGGAGALDDGARRRVGFGSTAAGEADEKEEDWGAHPLAAMHEYEALLESVRRENVLLEGLVRRRAYGELDGRVFGRESDVGQKGKKVSGQRREDSQGTVPPPSQPDQNTVKPEPSALVNIPATREPAFGGFGFLELPAPAAPASSVNPATKDDQALDKSPKPAPAAQGKDAAPARVPVPTPIYGPNLLARETFAGGATTGSWHLDRRRMLGAERCFGDILAQLG